MVIVKLFAHLAHGVIHLRMAGGTQFRRRICNYATSIRIINNVYTNFLSLPFILIICLLNAARLDVFTQ